MIVQGYDRRSPLVLLGVGRRPVVSVGALCYRILSDGRYRSLSDGSLRVFLCPPRHRFELVVPDEQRDMITLLQYRGQTAAGFARHLAVDSEGRQVFVITEDRNALDVVRAAERALSPESRSVVVSAEVRTVATMETRQASVGGDAREASVSREGTMTIRGELRESVVFAEARGDVIEDL